MGSIRCIGGTPHDSVQAQNSSISTFSKMKINKFKKKVFSNMISEFGTKQKGLFKITVDLMGHKEEIILPSYSFHNDLPNKGRLPQLEKPTFNES